MPGGPVIEWTLKILVIGFFAWAGWTLLQTRYLFEIRIRGGQPRVSRGKVTRAFLDRVAQACQDGGVDHGWLGGVQQGRRTALRFSRHFPPGSQQRLRNEWQATA
jgi:hypothetical protein